MTAAIDLRCGMDPLPVRVREILDRNPLDWVASGHGADEVLRTRAATRIKAPCCDAQGTWLAVRRFQEGRFIRPVSGVTTWSLDSEQSGQTLAAAAGVLCASKCW